MTSNAAMPLFGTAGEGGKRLPHRAAAWKPRRHQVAQPQRVSDLCSLRSIVYVPTSQTTTPPPRLTIWALRTLYLRAKQGANLHGRLHLIRYALVPCLVRFSWVKSRRSCVYKMRNPRSVPPGSKTSEKTLSPEKQIILSILPSTSVHS